MKAFAGEVSPFQNKSAVHSSESLQHRLPEKMKQTPTKDPTSCEKDYNNFLDISMSSLTNDEIYELIDSVSSQKTKPITPNNKQVSPAKNYVRSKSVELNSLPSNVNANETRLFTEGMSLVSNTSCKFLDYSYGTIF